MTEKKASSELHDEPGFASRWSRLKQEAKTEPEEENPEVDADAETLVEDDRTDEEILAELELPDPDTLKTGDDFKAFMAKAVPARIRNRALRKLWISNPVLANLDELIDYGDDFTDAANVIENLQTSYEVGKGFAGKLSEALKEAGESPAEPGGEEPGEEEPQAADEALDETAEVNEEAAVDDAVIDDASGQEEPVQMADQAAPEPRVAARQRMRFRVAEE